MTTFEQVETRCPRCGYLDVGHYCSNCSYPLNQPQTSVYKEMYHSFFLKFFQEGPVSHFLRTWWRVLLRPGGIVLQETYSPGSRYMSDIKFSKTIFFLALGTIILNLFVGPSEDKVGELAMKWFFQSYVLWIFCFSLLGFIWIGRTWKKFMRYEVEDLRQFDSMYIYEYGLLMSVIYVLSFIYSNEIESITASAWLVNGEAVESLTEAEQKANQEVENISDELKTVGLVLLIIFALRFFWFHLALGFREHLPKIKLLLVTLLCIYLLIFYIFAAEVMTIPIIVLPLLFILSPVYYAARNLWVKFRS